MFPKKIKGFTLIELLVVISIIALLLSVLMPSLQRAKGQAKMVLCGNNQRQIIVGVCTYTIDSQDLPPSIQGLATDPIQWSLDPSWLSYHSSNDTAVRNGLNGGSVGRQLYSYINEPDVFFCPLTRYAQNYEGSSRTMEDRWEYGSGGPDGNWAWPDGALLNTNFILWNYQGWQDGRLFSDRNEGFKGPGKNSRNTLMLVERIIWGPFNGVGPNRWVATHPFNGASRGGGSMNDGPSWWIMDDDGGFSGNVPVFKYELNAGYSDGSVRRYNANETLRVGTRGFNSFIPKNWR